MKRSVRFGLGPNVVLVLVVALLTTLAIAQGSSSKESKAAAWHGQSVTFLPDGSQLLLGGQKGSRPSGSALLVDPITSRSVLLPSGLAVARAWHSATVIADGSVLVIGGVGRNGQTIRDAERFDPQVKRFTLLTLTGLTPRSHHTATLLTDGRILIAGGLGANGEATSESELLDPRTSTITAVPDGLLSPRFDHSAVLLSGGQVEISGGKDDHGETPPPEIFDPIAARFVHADNSLTAPIQTPPVISGSIPRNGDVDVDPAAVFALRFSEPMQIKSLNASTIELSSYSGIVQARVVGAENGRLAFITPESALQPSTKYVIRVNGVADGAGEEIKDEEVSFATAARHLVGEPSSASAPSAANAFLGGSESWIPDRSNLDNWRSGRAHSKWQDLPPLRARKGVTAVSGQVLKLDGTPLRNVVLSLGTAVAKSDATGRFILTKIPVGHQVLAIDGHNAPAKGIDHGLFEVGLQVKKGQTNVVPFTIWLPLIDNIDAVQIPSPTTQETVVTSPFIPGLELHIPAGTVIRDLQGHPVTSISITPIPVDRTPFPLPTGYVPIYFTIQPGAAVISNPKWLKARLIYPNYHHEKPGKRLNFWDYDPFNNGWYVYGFGNVTSDGKQVVPDPGIGIYQFTGAMINSGLTPANQADAAGSCDGAGDPISCGSGLFYHSETDLVEQDVIPLVLRRTYRTKDGQTRPFGIGTNFTYGIFLWSANQYQEADLVLPGSERIHYVRISPGTGFIDAVFQHTSSPTIFYGSQIAWNGQGWNLTLKNGTVYVFGENAPLQSIRDRYGNTVTLTRTSGQSGNITQVTSPNGRWIAFTYDTANRITQAQDNIGRTVTYTYDKAGATCNSQQTVVGLLCSVTDAKGGVTKYTYDANKNMLTVTDARGNVKVTNTYDANQRVSKQVLADGTSTYQFSYLTDSNGNVTQAMVTDPRGTLRTINFNSKGYITSDTDAVGAPEQQAYTYQVDPNTNLTTSITDQLSRQTTFSYDANGNITNVTRLAGTPQAVSTSMTYNSTFSELTSVTDPLNHTWNLTYDNRGNLTAIADPLNDTTALTYDSLGELLSVADQLSDTMQFTYNFGDLASITDPNGNTANLFADAIGRVMSVVDPAGNRTTYGYDSMSRLLSITDANSGVTSFTYDPNENLLSVSDANNNKTSYVYDKRNRVTSRTDALLKVDNYTYDGNSNLTSHTDRNGNVINYTYDGLNRLTQAQYNIPGKRGPTLQSTVSYTWDVGNRVTQAVDSIAGTMTRTWDGLDRLTQEQTPQGTVSYTYDNAGRRATMTVAGQNQVSYTWDNANRLTGISQGTSSVGFSYDTANRRSQLTLPNGVTVAYSYDKDSHITGLTYSAGSTQLGALTYSYDADGRRTTVGGSLAAVTLPSNVAGGTSTAYNADNEQSKFNGTGLTYDAAGNLTGDGTNTYTWDARGHLAQIAQGRTTTASFQYDAFGRRSQKTIGATTTQFLYDGLNPIQELQSGSPVANMMTGLRIDEYFARTDSTGTSSFLADALGSTIGLVGSSGAIATSYTYQPFGTVTAGGAASGNTYQFTGRENDGTGFYFHRARYYSSTLQRFVSQDPIGFGGSDTNLYAYVWNDPLDFLDLFGLDPLTVDQIANILFNETQSMSGQGIDAARVDLAHALINGSDEHNPPAHAPDTLPRGLNRLQRGILTQRHQAAQIVVNEDDQGIDPTNGAELYNMRRTDSNARNRNYTPARAPSMILGPFDNSYNDYRYIDIYPQITAPTTGR